MHMNEEKKKEREGQRDTQEGEARGKRRER